MEMLKYGCLGVLGGREDGFILLEGPPKQRDRHLGCLECFLFWPQGSGFFDTHDPASWRRKHPNYALSGRGRMGHIS